MRPASSGAMADCLPSVSGRGVQPSPYAWQYARNRHFMGINSVPKRVMSSSVSIGLDQADQAASDFSSQDAEPISKPTRPDALQVAMRGLRGSNRDIEGRSLAGRKKPLKINLDLALVSIFFKRQLFCFMSYKHSVIKIYRTLTLCSQQPPKLKIYLIVYIYYCSTVRGRLV